MTGQQIPFKVNAFIALGIFSFHQICLLEVKNLGSCPNNDEVWRCVNVKLILLDLEIYLFLLAGFEGGSAKNIYLAKRSHLFYACFDVKFLNSHFGIRLD